MEGAREGGIGRKEAYDEYVHSLVMVSYGGEERDTRYQVCLNTELRNLLLEQVHSSWWCAASHKNFRVEL